jgi:predicted XRE-type DNA-binding protein
MENVDRKLGSSPSWYQCDRDKHTNRLYTCRTMPKDLRRKELPSKRSVENEYKVSGSILDQLGFDRQGALELKLKAALHQNILRLIKRRKYSARDLERILSIQQPRVSELTRGKISTLSVARLLLYADLLGARAEVKLKQLRAKAAA